MRHNHLLRFRHITWLLLAVILLPLAAPLQADNTTLLEKYQILKPALEKNVYGIPVYINSNNENHIMLGEVYGVLSNPYREVRQALVTAETWCDIVPQHLNIKACTYEQRGNYWQLIFYSGRKFYEKADDVYQLSYRFTVPRADEKYFQTTLTASDGPMGTSDYRIEAEAIPLTDTRTFIHFKYSYKYNFLTTVGMETYLATLGSNKIGFTITGKDEHGNPIHVGDVRGIIERNTIRYYFAIQSYLDTAAVEPGKRFAARINQWFDLTERHPLQLHELEKQEYLQFKHQEHADQLRLQQQLQPPAGVKSPQP